MFDLLFESFRKASESSMQVPMDIIKNLERSLGELPRQCFL